MKIRSRVVQGSVTFHVLEDLGDLGDHHHEEDADDGDAHHHHDRRVEHGADDLVAQLRLGFGEVGEAHQHHVERARALAGADHVDVEVAEDLGVLSQRGGERRAFVSPSASPRP